MQSKTVSLLLLMALSLFVLAGCAIIAPPSPQASAPTKATAAQPTAASTEVTSSTASLPLSTTATVEPTKAAASATALTFNNSAWNYDAEHNVYWQIGVQYVANPATTKYESLGIYVPGAYSLNAAAKWVTYDAATNTARITSLADFATYVKKATKSVPAFDDLAQGQAENQVFGNDESDARHFDFTVADLLTKNQATYVTYADWDASLVVTYTTDLAAVDKLGNGSQERQNMYNPMYYLLASYAGYQTSTVAKHWRIRTGIEQGDTASTVEVNLALALKHYAGVADVDFATVWNQGHTMAERTGNSTDNFIAWVNEVVKQ